MSVRGISDKFIKDLNNGILSPILERVKCDDTLELDIREDFVNIYYRGGSIVKIKEEGGGYRIYSNPKYVIGDKYFENRIINLKKVINKSQSEKWIYEILPHFKGHMDFYFGAVKKSYEREYQQHVIRDNNSNGDAANSTDYFILDIEYSASQKYDFDTEDENKKERIDMVGVMWSGENKGAKRRNPENMRLALIEMKYGEKAINGTSGLVSHLEGIYDLITNPKYLIELYGSAENIMKQKVELGVLKNDCFKNVKDDFKMLGDKAISVLNNVQELEDKEEKIKVIQKELKKLNIEVIILLANYKVRSTNLKIAMKEIKNNAKCNDLMVLTDVKFSKAINMGYGLYKDDLINIEGMIDIEDMFENFGIE